MGVGSPRHAAVRPGRSHGTYCRGDWVGPRAGLDGYGDGTNFTQPPAFEPRLSKPQRVAIPTTRSRPSLRRMSPIQIPQ